MSTVLSTKTYQQWQNININIILSLSNIYVVDLCISLRCDICCLYYRAVTLLRYLKVGFSWHWDSTVMLTHLPNGEATTRDSQVICGHFPF